MTTAGGGLSPGLIAGLGQALANANPNASWKLSRR